MAMSLTEKIQHQILTRPLVDPRAVRRSGVNPDLQPRKSAKQVHEGLLEQLERNAEGREGGAGNGIEERLALIGRLLRLVDSVDSNEWYQRGGDDTKRQQRIDVAVELFKEIGDDIVNRVGWARHHSSSHRSPDGRTDWTEERLAQARSAGRRLCASARCKFLSRQPTTTSTTIPNPAYVWTKLANLNRLPVPSV
jgi:hypothetical protein